MRRRRAFLLLLAFAWPLAARAATPPPLALGDKETIVFVGDSITAAGHYVRYIEAYLATRFPDRTFRLIQSGRRSETVSGLSEPDHPGKRPVLFERWDEAVTAHAPDRVVACYGMNDGIYHPWSDERFGCFQTGIGQLLSRVHDQMKVPLLLLTPPVWDVEARPVPAVSAGESYSWKKPFAGYDEVLERYSEWLRGLAGPGVDVADVHRAFKAHLGARREDTPDFKFQRDGIHPDETGHLLMALAVLDAWHAPDLVSEATIDARTKRVLAGEVAGVRYGKGGVEFSWTSKLPMPADEKWDPVSVALERFTERFNRHRLTVRGLRSGTYALVADSHAVGTFSAEQLAEGLDLTALAEFPTTKASRSVLARLRERRDGDSGLRDLCRPLTLAVSVRPTGERP
jgi:lysophospholipase L1-like esterase